MILPSTLLKIVPIWLQQNPARVASTMKILMTFAKVSMELQHTSINGSRLHPAWDEKKANLPTTFRFKEKLMKANFCSGAGNYLVFIYQVLVSFESQGQGICQEAFISL